MEGRAIEQDNEYGPSLTRAVLEPQPDKAYQILDVPKYAARVLWCCVATYETVTLTSIRGVLKKLSELDSVVNTIVDQHTSQTLLHKAILRSRSEEEGVADVQLLANLGADLECIDCEGRRALHFAVKNGKHQIISALIGLGAEVNILDNQGRSPLTYVAIGFAADPPGLLSQLLAAGADPNIYGQSIPPLHAAARFRPELCRPLLDAGAYIHACGRGDSTAGVLQSACLSGIVRLSTIRLLLDAGAKVNARGSPEDTALKAAIRREHSHVVSLLIENGANIHMNFLDTQQAATLGISDDTAITALSVAVAAGNQEIVEMLLGAGACLNCVAVDGRSLLDSSLVHSLSSKLASTLIENGVGVNQPGSDGRTPLHTAAMSGGDTFEKVELLLQNGADIQARCSSRRNALHYAATKDILGGQRDPRVICLLFEAGVDPTATDENEYTPLHLASQNGLESLVDELLKISWNVANYSDSTGRTPLHLASEMDQVDVIRKLLVAGANIHAKDHSGQTALHLAAASGCEKAVKCLIAHGASRKKRDKKGKTARQVAVANGHKWVIMALDQEMPTGQNIPFWLALGCLLIAWLYVIAFLSNGRYY